VRGGRPHPPSPSPIGEGASSKEIIINQETLDGKPLANRRGASGAGVRSNGIIFNQQVSTKKVLRARELRKGMTEAEKIFWETVRDRRLNNLKFRRQQIIDGFIADFYCDELNLCVEIDGPVHDLASQKEWDVERDAVLSRRGIKLIRITNEDVMLKIDQVKEMIGDLIPRPSFGGLRTGFLR
jgi:very-short-patch-repair endonuclease